MSQGRRPQRRRPGQGQGQGGQGGNQQGQVQQKRPADFWRDTPEPDLAGSVGAAAEPTALLRSLGTPPIPTQAAAGQYFAAVVERASALATALGAAAGILEVPAED